MDGAAKRKAVRKKVLARVRAFGRWMAARILANAATGNAVRVCGRWMAARILANAATANAARGNAAMAPANGVVGSE
jgi:hypothetical protein